MNAHSHVSSPTTTFRAHSTFNSQPPIAKNSGTSKQGCDGVFSYCFGSLWNLRCSLKSLLEGRYGNILELQQCMWFFKILSIVKEFSDSRINLLIMLQTINHCGWDFQSAALIWFYWNQWELCHLLQLSHPGHFQCWPAKNVHASYITVDAPVAFWSSRLLPWEQQVIPLDAVAFYLLATFMVVVIRKLQCFLGLLWFKLQETFLRSLIAKLAKLAGNALAVVSNGA